MPIIEIEIDEDGKIEADYKGFKGKDCLKAEKDLIKKLKELHIEKKATKMKPEALHEKQKRKR
jgi:valyl-tRNA synthetase